MVGGSLGHSAHEMAEFKIFGVKRKKVSSVAVLDFKITNFKLLRELLSTFPWKTNSGGLGIHEF